MPFYESDSKEKRVALLIGNADYQSEGASPLRNPVNDARAIGSALSELNFSEIIIKENLDYTAMRTALFEFGRTAEVQTLHLSILQATG